MTGKATKTGKELEQRVANAYRQMGARKVEHDVELAGNQIDVYCCNSNPQDTKKMQGCGISSSAMPWKTRGGADHVTIHSPRTD